MIKHRIIVRTCLLISFLVAGVSRGLAADEPANFKEVYELLRSHLAGVDETELNQAAVEGLITRLGPKVRLVGDATPTNGATNAPGIIHTAMFEGAYGYLRVGSVEAGSDKQMSAAYQQLAASNRLKGVVVDLRFAGGEDYAAATAMADWFFATEQPLIDWGDGLRKSTSKTNAMALPVTLLVNRQTSGAAEAFAGILRQAEIGLLIGSNTAGQASIAREFPLKNGQRLRIATTPVKLGKEGQPFPVTGLKPDIQVEVPAEDERAYFADAYKVLPKPARLANSSGSSTNETTLASTNRSSRRRINEAELVRMLRDGQTPDAELATAARETGSARPVVNDPALARALDLLKGLAVVQQFRSI